MQLAVLPECRWRGGPTAAGRWACASPKIIAPANGVTAMTCERCFCQDHGRSGELLKLVPPPANDEIGYAYANPTRPLVVVTLAVGPLGRQMLNVVRPRMEAYAERVGADFRTFGTDHSPFPPGEKFRLGRFLKTWERVLFLDADVVIGDDCPDLFGLVPPGLVGMHDDAPDVGRIAGLGWLADQYADLARSQGRPTPPEFAGCLNTGVVVFDRAHPDLWRAPIMPYPAYHCGEQNAVNWNLRRAGYPVFPLPGEMNYQWWAHPHMEGPAHVWHYAKPPGASDQRRLEMMAERANPPTGPGTELKKLLASIGIQPGRCACDQRAKKMDQNGVGWVRENRAEIVDWLNAERKKRGWGQALIAAFGAVRTGLAFRLDPRDVAGSLVDEAVRRAEA